MNFKQRFGLSGLTINCVRKHPAVIPIHMIGVIGWGWAAFYIWRLATKSPEVTWARHSNPEPWNEYANKQYKFLASGRDYSVGSPAPKYK